MRLKIIMKFSGTNADGTKRAIQLLQKSCKTPFYQVQLLSDFGIGLDGHMVMFEAISFGSSTEGRIKKLNIKIT